jgi:DNA-binding transcriptional LysR family regulator
VISGSSEAAQRGDTVEVTFRQLEIFRWVVIAGSITKASHRIGLSQPSISQQLAKLEEALNVQLIVRNRTGIVSMTPAGEFWFKSSEDILGRITNILNDHEQRFRHSNVVLKLGATPGFRGRFTSAAARIAGDEPDFVKLDLVYDLTSTALVERLRMHQINMAIVSESAIANDLSSFATQRVFEDRMAWAVPAEIGDEAIRYALSADAKPERIEVALRRYVEIDPLVPTRAASDDWYRSHLPPAMATYSAQTFAASVEFVAEGLATCHIPISLLPNLSEPLRSRIKVFVIDGMSRTIVLAMFKHLLSHTAFSRIFTKLATFCRTDYAAEMALHELPHISSVLPERPSGTIVHLPKGHPGLSVARPMGSIGKSNNR